MNLRFVCVVVFLSALAVARGEELVFAGALGNSGGVVFSGEAAPGMGVVLDDEGMLWERGGAGRLNRYARDGRMVGSFVIAKEVGRGDQMTRVGGLLVMKIGPGIYRLGLGVEEGAEPERISGEVEVLSTGSSGGRVVVFERGAGALRWLDPVTGEREEMVAGVDGVGWLHVDEDGTVYAFGRGEVRAWKDGEAVAGFPRGFQGERPQKIGRYWFSHAWHGTINRMNEAFEPSPGVVLGGASGSFIGYLPQSADLTNGRGMVELGGGVFAVSGMGGVVQLFVWDAELEKFSLGRRIGALDGIGGVAVDAAGRIWTGRGSWRWGDSAEVPMTEGDKEPDVAAQPVVLGGKTLCLLKKHYSYVQLARGALIDASGWSHLETPGIEGFELGESVTGAAAVPEDGGSGFELVFVERGGKAYSVGVTGDGRRRGEVVEVEVPGLEECTSLGWFDGRLVAADGGSVIAYVRDGERRWKEVERMGGFRGEVFVHGDGGRLVVADTAGGVVVLFGGWGEEVARYGGLESPRQVAVSGKRVVVFEAGKQRLVKLELREVVEEKVVAVEPLAAVGGVVEPAAVEFVDYSRPGGMGLALAVADSESGLAISVRSEAERVRVGVAGAERGYVAEGDGEFDFLLPKGDWSGLRLVVGLEGAGQREGFFFDDHRAIYAGFSDDVRTWGRFDLARHVETVQAQAAEIRVGFEMVDEGKATVVIEDGAGKRVRNLVSGRRFLAGEQTVVWDGLDEEGKLVAPGKYRWRGVRHAGVEPVFKMAFANGGEDTVAPWGPNHSTLQDVVGQGELVFFAAPVTEGGWALMALDAEGNFVQGYDHQHGYGIQHDAIAADEKYLYCAQDGAPWGGMKGVDRGSDSWTATWKVTVVRYDIETGKVVEFSGGRKALEVDTMEVGPGSAHTDLDAFNLGGLAVSGGKLYVGSRDKEAVLVVDAESGERVGSVPLAGVRRLVAAGGEVFAAADAGVVRVRDGKVLVAAGEMELTGLAIGAGGDVFVSDRTTHQVRQFSAEGKAKGVIGKPGGAYKGAYDLERMVNPAGLAFGPDGKLWVTEDRWNPKRVLAWDLEKGEVVYEKFGMPHYGGDGSGFDPENPRRWIGLGCFWDVDIDAGTARPTHVLSLEEGHFGNYEPQSYVFFREGGRRFVCARGKISLVSEVLADGTLHDLVAVAGTHHFAYGCGWDPPQSYIDAFYAKWPEKRAQAKGNGERQPWSQRGMGVLWVDRNGDGEAQAEEFDFCGDKLEFGGGAWGHLQTSLRLVMPVGDDDGVRVVEIAPRGFLANGVPDYPGLDEAIAGAQEIGLMPGYKRSGVATVRDRAGRTVFNSDPEMNAYFADGRHAWRFPNRWSDVHGSHDAPLPKPGVMQGTLGILGLAAFDDEADVIFLNGNHGRCFLLTTDGLYLDEAFVDVRVSYLKNEYRLGGEIFGGSFGRSVSDGKYYVQIGHGPYRIYELEGLAGAERMGGMLEVTAAQIAVAETRGLREAAEVKVEREVVLPGTVGWDQDGKFKAELDLRVDGELLHLHYRVEDSSPWVNHGREWEKLFATGDTVDLQIGTDPEADPGRRGPVEGDVRLMIAPFEGEAVAVLFEHRKAGGANPVEFVSPWRGEKVDEVRMLEGVEIEVKTAPGGYEVVAAVPLEVLGLRLEAGRRYAADFGVTFGDAGGTDTNLRSYWSNRSTHLVDDIPGEIMLVPNLWGGLRVGEE